MTKTTKTPQQLKTERLLRNLESMLQRRDAGQLDGRNDAASQQHLRFSLKRTNEALCELEDELGIGHPVVDRLAARVNRAERRRLGLPV
jgi:hypothetical protein